MNILFSTGTCVLGRVLVATSERGVCAILLGEHADDLAREVRKVFPRAQRQDDDPALAALVAKVAELVAEPGRGIDFPLDLRGNGFEQRVWNALREIPAGARRTYGEIAAHIGEPKAAKEVGEACGANVLAVAVPCHRVVRKDGGLAGYRWGVHRKRALLQLERSAA